MTKNLLLSVLLLVILTTTSSFAQNRYNFDQFFTEGGRMFTNVKNWDGNDWTKLSLIVGASYGISFLDESVKEGLQPVKSLQGTIPIDFGRMWGEPTIWGGLSSILLVHGLLADNKKNQHTAFEIAQIMVFDITITTALKIIVGRSRPYISDNAHEFNPFHFIPNEKWSYPSGHTSSAFAFSTVLAENVQSDLLKVLCYFPAVMTAFSRVYENRHWTSDVFAGAFLGYFVAKYFTELHNKNEALEGIQPPAQLINFTIPL